MAVANRSDARCSMMLLFVNPGYSIVMGICVGHFPAYMLRLPLQLQNLPRASDTSDWPNATWLAGTLQLVGRVPKRPQQCSLTTVCSGKPDTILQ